jgi:hypothetical protein
VKKLQIIIIGVMFLLSASVANAFQATVNRLDLLTPSDTTQNITQTGYYRITVRGADGGNNTRAGGGSGATVAATFLLQASDVLTLVTGIAGGIAATYAGAGGGGGGGGSAVILTRSGVSTLLIVAGAGGGANSLTGGGGGISAQGIAGGGRTDSAAGGGGGFNANGETGALSTGGGAGTLSGGGAGGGSYGVGGYGFGGGGGGSGVGGGGGGGGYGGGNARAGGTSFVNASGTNITRTEGTTGAANNQNGSVSIAATTAASVSISGRVLINTNRGLANAVVYLTDAEGKTHAARTNSFGYYRFQDVQAGQTVTVTVISKRYQFAPQVLNLNEEMHGVNFLAEQ